MFGCVPPVCAVVFVVQWGVLLVLTALGACGAWCPASWLPCLCGVPGACRLPLVKLVVVHQSNCPGLPSRNGVPLCCPLCPCLHLLCPCFSPTNPVPAWLLCGCVVWPWQTPPHSTPSQPTKGDQVLHGWWCPSTHGVFVLFTTRSHAEHWGVCMHKQHWASHWAGAPHVASKEWKGGRAVFDLLSGPARWPVPQAAGGSGWSGWWPHLGTCHQRVHWLVG